MSLIGTVFVVMPASGQGRIQPADGSAQYSFNPASTPQYRAPARGDRVRFDERPGGPNHARRAINVTLLTEAGIVPRYTVGPSQSHRGAVAPVPISPASGGTFDVNRSINSHIQRYQAHALAEYINKEQNPCGEITIVAGENICKYYGASTKY